VTAAGRSRQELRVRIGERERHVEVRRAGTGWEVRVDGVARHVDMAQVGSWISLLVGRSAGGPAEEAGAGAALGRPLASYEIAIDDRGGGELVVHVNGVAVPVAIPDPRSAWRARQQDAAVPGRGRGDVRAPMPGRILKVLVKRGDAVAARQGLVVVEAMKMENELREPKDGRVADVRVSEGMSVEANAILITLE